MKDSSGCFVFRTVGDFVYVTASQTNCQLAVYLTNKQNAEVRILIPNNELDTTKIQISLEDSNSQAQTRAKISGFFVYLQNVMLNQAWDSNLGYSDYAFQHHAPESRDKDWETWIFEIIHTEAHRDWLMLELLLWMKNFDPIK
jgi:hypothetical protein